MESDLLFNIDKKKYYRNHLNGTTHYLINNWSKKDKSFKGSETLCGDNSEHLFNYNYSPDIDINCPYCKEIKAKLEL